MAKKVIAVLLVCCFVALLTTSAFAGTDDNSQQQKALIAVVGLCALVGILFMLSRMDKKDFSDSHLPSFLQNNSGKGFKINLGLNPQPPSFAPQEFANPNESITPALSVVYRW